MDIPQHSGLWASYAYVYCILTLLCGEGAAIPYYNDRRGQPELQQAMDNAPLLPARNLLPSPSAQHRDIPFFLTEKTSALLSEALHMLHKIKDVRERKWLEALVHRLGSLAADLEEDNSVKTTDEVQEAVLRPFETAQYTMPSSNSVAREFHRSQSKNQVTSVQVNDGLPVSEGNINREAGTKSSLVFDARKDSVEDLLKQLHSQVRKMKSESSPGVPVAYKARFLDTTVTTQAVTSPTNSNGKNNPKHVVQAQMEIRKHYEEAEKDDLFEQIDSQHLADFTNTDFVHGQKHNPLESVTVMEKNDDDAGGAPQASAESAKTSVSPSWQKAMETTYGGVSRAQLHNSIKYFIPAEPTMSDEMERELRSGKIVVLSHSLVRTNFKSKHGNNKEGSVAQPISPSEITKSDALHLSSKF